MRKCKECAQKTVEMMKEEVEAIYGEFGEEFMDIFQTL